MIIFEVSTKDYYFSHKKISYIIELLKNIRKKYGKDAVNQFSITWSRNGFIPCQRQER